MTYEKYHHYSPTILRVVVGLMFIIAGFMKLMNPAGPTGMLAGLGFPAASALAWVLLLVEIVFGAAVLAGWKLKYTVWPLVFVMVVALFTVVIPGAMKNPGMTSNVFFHLLTIAALITLFFGGPGKMALDRH